MPLHRKDMHYSARFLVTTRLVIYFLGFGRREYDLMGSHIKSTCCRQIFSPQKLWWAPLVNGFHVAECSVHRKAFVTVSDHSAPCTCYIVLTSLILVSVSLDIPVHCPGFFGVVYFIVYRIIHHSCHKQHRFNTLVMSQTSHQRCCMFRYSTTTTCLAMFDPA